MYNIYIYTLILYIIYKNIYIYICLLYIYIIMFTLHRYIQCLYCTANCHQPTSMVWDQGNLPLNGRSFFQDHSWSDPVLRVYTFGVFGVQLKPQRCVDSKMVSMKFRLFLGIHHSIAAMWNLWDSQENQIHPKVVLGFPQIQVPLHEKKTRNA